MKKKKNSRIVWTIIVFIILSAIILYVGLWGNPSTIEFDSNGGNEISSCQYNNYDYILEEAPIKEGYSFDGWYNDPAYIGEQLEKIHRKSGDIKLYAKWVINQYVISFDSNGGSNVDSIEQDYNSEVFAPEEPTKAGYTFDKWCTDENLTNEYNFSTMPAEDFTLYAKWTVNGYTISFDSNGGSSVNAISGNFNTSISEPHAPTKEFYLFYKWYTDSEFTHEFIFNTMPSNDITLYAKYIPKSYTITYITSGGNTISPSNYRYGEPVFPPEIPTKEYYSFDKWYSDSIYQNQFFFVSMPGQNISLYAKWIPYNYEISFDTNEGSEITPIVVAYGSDLPSFEIPTKTGYHLVGWCTDENMSVAFTDTTMPAKNLTLYAKWAVNSNMLIFNSNGGSEVENIYGNFGENVYEPLSPTKQGYIFDKWYIDEALSEEFDFSSMPADSTTLYAGWNLISDGLMFSLINEDTEYEVSQGTETGSNVVIPSLYKGKPVTKIADNAFNDYVDINVSEFYSSPYDFKENGIFDLETIEIPDSITVIGKDAFSYCIGITEINLPDSIISIEEQVFSNCMNLSDISLPYNLLSLGNNAFSCDLSLENISLPDSLVYMGEYCFNFCENLQNIVLPNNITKIMNNTFNNCKNLRNITLSENITEIGRCAFIYCWNLQSISIPNTINEIKEEAFANCALLTNVIMEGEIPPTIGSDVFSDCNDLLFLQVPRNKVAQYRTAWIAYEEKINGRNAEITFITNCDIIQNIQVINYDSLLPELSRKGFEFKGWFMDSDCTISYDFGYIENDYISIYAKWETSVI